jgi:hypothetical protein
VPAAVVLATGATYRRLEVAEVGALVGAGVFYGGPVSEAPAMAGREVYVLGGANSAGQGHCTWLNMPSGLRSWCEPSRSTRGCRTTWPGRSRGTPTSRCASGPRSSAWGRRLAGKPGPSAPRRRSDGDRGGRRALPDDRRPPEHGLAACGADAGGGRVRSHRSGEGSIVIRLVHELFAAEQLHAGPSEGPLPQRAQPPGDR